MFHDVFEGALERVERSKDLEELRTAVHDLLIPYDLRHAVYHAICLPGAVDEHPLLVFTYPQDWISHYFARRYDRIDPVVLRGKRSVVPIDWNALDRSSPPVRALFEEASDAGLGRQGLTLPIRGAQGDHAIFTVTSQTSEQEWAKLRPFYMRDMQLLGNYVHARVLDLSGVSPADNEGPLSRRERECLQWAAVGLTIGGTAEKLRLSDRVVRGYLDSARHKLGCLTKTQAVAKASMLGVVHPR